MPAPLNALQQKELAFPKEIQLPFAISWKVTASTFRDHTFFGTGPATYLFDFTTYKPLEFNQLAFWNFSFSSAYNEFLHVLATLGILGFSALVFICLIVLRLSWKNLAPAVGEGEHDSTSVLLPAIAISGFLSVALLAVHATTVISTIITFFIFAILMLSQRAIREKVLEFSLGIRATTSNNTQFDLFPVIIFVVFLIGAVPAFYQLITMTSADYYHRKALAQASTNGTLTYQYLQKAESMNPQVDLYRVDMAQTNFALANAIAIQKGPTQANPKGSLTDQDKQTIQTLLSQAVNEGRSGVILSPQSSRNWQVLGSVYQSISGVAQNSLSFALQAYSQAIQMDPLNPALRLNAGNIYYTAKNYPLAIRFFTDAINLKPDYANAYYNLAIALRESGDLQNAQAVAQQLVTLVQKNNDQNSIAAAKALLDDINTRIAKTNAAPATQTPTGQNESALQNPNLPAVDVSNLKNPPQVTPAPAVKSNPSAKVPQPTAEPTKATAQ